MDLGILLIYQFIEKYKYCSVKTMDITVPNYSEDITFVIENIKGLIQLGEEHNPRLLNEKQYNSYIKEKEKLINLVPFYAKNKIEKELNRIRKFLWWREKLKDLSVRVYDRVRHFTLEVAKRLKNKNIINHKNDIFYFPIEYVISIIKGEFTQEKISKDLQRNKYYYNSFRNYENISDIGFVTKIINKNNINKAYKGIACSSGIVRGKVKIIKNVNELDKLEKGDILVTNFTDAAWSPIFNLISGIITETGGILAHAAILSREYGIPAVLAVNNITSKLKNRQEIVVDGNQGQIYAL